MDDDPLSVIRCVTCGRPICGGPHGGSLGGWRTVEDSQDPDQSPYACRHRYHGHAPAPDPPYRLWYVDEDGQEHPNDVIPGYDVRVYARKIPGMNRKAGREAWRFRPMAPDDPLYAPARSRQTGS